MHIKLSVLIPALIIIVFAFALSLRAGNREASSPLAGDSAYLAQVDAGVPPCPMPYRDAPLRRAVLVDQEQRMLIVLAVQSVCWQLGIAAEMEAYKLDGDTEAAKGVILVGAMKHLAYFNKQQQKNGYTDAAFKIECERVKRALGMLPPEK